MLNAGIILNNNAVDATKPAPWRLLMSEVAAGPADEVSAVCRQMRPMNFSTCSRTFWEVKPNFSSSTL